MSNTIRATILRVADTSQTPAPFREQLRRRMAEGGYTFRSLAKRTKEVDPDGRGLTFGYLGAVVRGDDDIPSLRALALIAAALEESPEIFVEYRLGTVRNMLDEREVGLDEAWANLNALNEALRA